MTDWSLWVYSASLRQHRRYYRGTEPLKTGSSWGVIEKTNGHYRWALFINAKPTVYGEAPTLLAAKRAVDRAEASDRLVDAAERLDKATAEFNEARAAHRAIVAELRGDKGSHPKE
jgi:hypothetical protein